MMARPSNTTNGGVAVPRARRLQQWAPSQGKGRAWIRHTADCMAYRRVARQLMGTRGPRIPLIPKGP